MSSYFVMFSFFVVALMRVIQKICSKKVSRHVVGKTFFHYGGYYNLMSALFSLITLAIAGFVGFDMPTVLCALGTAFLMGIELFTGIEALKECSLIISQMFSVGAMFIPCIVGIFLFDEPMTLLQWIGLVLFMVAMYFMISPSKKRRTGKNKRLSLRTIILLIVGLFASGGVMIVQKVFGVLVPNGNVAAYSFLMFALSSLLLYVCYFYACLKKESAPDSGETGSEDGKNGRLSRLLLICGFLLAFAVFAVNMLITNLGKSIESAILFSVSYAISIIITILVDSLYYKEKLNFRSAFGIFLCVISLAIINFYNEILAFFAGVVM